MTASSSGSSSPSRDGAAGSATAGCVISVSGFRGVVGQGMDAGLAMRIASAYGRCIAQGGAVVLGRDSRPTGELLAQAVAAGLRGVGCTVIDLGIVPTPTVPIAQQALGAAGGVQISASHNPIQWNALKLFDGRGRNIDGGQLTSVLAAMDAVPVWSTWDQVGQQRCDGEALERHLTCVLAAVDVDRIRAAGLTVLIDCVNGAGSTLGPRLLDELGCRVVPLYNDPARPFPRDPEPTADKVVQTGAMVRAAGAAIGFVQDPDADRLALIDARGSYIGEEYTLVLAAAARFAAGEGRSTSKKVPVACTNLSTSRMIEDVAARHRGRVVRSAVGEANVVDAIQRERAIIGGEGNGGVIDPRVVLGRDSHIGMALVLELLARSGKSLAELVDDIPSYVMRKVKLPLDRAAVAAAASVLRTHPLAQAADCDERDGLKLSWSDRWLHLRASGTEPVSRLIVEAPDRRQADALVRDTCRIIRCQPTKGHA